MGSKLSKKSCYLIYVSHMVSHLDFTFRRSLSWLQTHNDYKNTVPPVSYIYSEHQISTPYVIHSFVLKRNTILPKSIPCFRKKTGKLEWTFSVRSFFAVKAVEAVIFVSCGSCNLRKLRLSTGLGFCSKTWSDTFRSVLIYGKEQEP